MTGGIGTVMLSGSSSTSSGPAGSPPPNRVILGQNTLFTKQFRGYSSYDANGNPLGTNPYRIVVVVAGLSYEHVVRRVYSDTVLEVEANLVVWSTWLPFTLGTPRGTGYLTLGGPDTEVTLPNSASREQLTVLCSDSLGNPLNNLPSSPVPTDVGTAASCKFTKELKPGYLLVVDAGYPLPLVRTITSILSDTQLTVDADFFQSNMTLTLDSSGNPVPLPWSSGVGLPGYLLAAQGSWTYVACPPRVGKRANGLGLVETHWDQTNNFKSSGAIARASGNIYRASGAANMKMHRIIGRGTRFESQMGPASTWGQQGSTVSTSSCPALPPGYCPNVLDSGNYFGMGPWMSVQINGDWETQLVNTTGTSGTYAEYVVVLENSFSEPLLKAVPWQWYTMLMKGYGKIRSYGRRVVSYEWADIEFSGLAGELTTQGFYGNSRFLTQLRTGYTITACGQTRMVNSIQSDVELTIDRPFTLGNREFYPAPGSQASVDSIAVRGLTRLLPLWPRGVMIQVIVTSLGTGSPAQPKFKYNVWWKTFKHTDDGDNNAADDICTLQDMQNGVDCGITMDYNNWFQLVDKELQKPFGVYIKWNQCDVGVGDPAGNCTGNPVFQVGDEWRLRVGDIGNCEYWISSEGERFINDDNANPPVCYNHGKCLSISTDAVTVADAQQRPQLTGTGLVSYSYTSFTLSAIPDPYNSNVNSLFTSTVVPGDIIRILVDNDPGNTNGKWKDIRVIRVLDDVTLVSDYQLPITYTVGTPCCNYQILKCAAGRRYGSNHDATSGFNLPQNSMGLVPDDTMLAYLPHPELNYYQTWSYKYCEIDPGCCGFRVSSVVQPQQFAYYFVRPDHSNYNLRIATHTVNDNIDMYTRRDDDGSGRPDTTNYHLTSVRESNPWAIDEDQADFGCTTQYLALAVLGGAIMPNGVNSTIVSPGDAYANSLSHFTQNPLMPNCESWTIGIMGDNRYPQTVGSSEYSARTYLEFNFPDFECQDSGQAPVETQIYGDYSHKPLCVQADLRFVRDADVVLNSDAAPKWVVRLTETKRRLSGAFTPWHVDGVPSYPNAQRSGAVWWYRKVHILDGFETNFVFQVTDPSQCGGDDKICDGADGFAFVLTNDARQESADSNSNIGWDCIGLNLCDPGGGAVYNGNNTYPQGLIGCPADGLGCANSKKSNTLNYYGEYQECTLGLRKAFSVEFDLFYNVERRDPKQGKQHWWINATEFISYNDNHLGVFSTTEPKYASQPWGASQPMLRDLHSDDENGAHYGSTPSVPTMADFQEHTVKIRYTRGFTTEKQGSGQISTTDIVTADGDRRRLKGNYLTKFKSELRTGFEFGYASRVKANVKVKMNRDITCVDPEVPTNFYACRQAPPVSTVGFGDDGEMTRVITIIDDDEANLEDTDILGATAEEVEVRITYMPAFNPKQDTDIDYNIIKEFPGEIQVFIDDMDRYVFQVAVEDRDMSKVLDTDGNAYIGFTASTGSKGFALPGYDPVEVHQTHDILAWNFCNHPGAWAFFGRSPLHLGA